MKLRTTTPVSKSRSLKGAFLIGISALMIIGSVPVINSNYASADQYEARIKALEADIAKYEAEAGQLSLQADSLQREVARLSGEKATIQAQVDISQEKFNQLNAEIVVTEAKIKENQDALGTTIADLYVDDDVSPIEMLASSTNIGDFLNKQEFRNSVKDQLSGTIKKVKVLKEQLVTQKTDVEKVLADQTAQKNALAAKEAEQQALLNQTNSDEAAYRNLSSQSQSRKLQLEREQQAAIAAALNRAGGGSAVAGDPNKGGYPANLANSNYDNPVVDPWGMYSRQCVSYTAWKVFQKNGYMPYWGGDRYVTINGARVFTSGHAKYWPVSARAAGIATGTTPRVGSTGVITSGQYGHIVWVDSINSDGTINISQYNELNKGGNGWGHYSERKNVSPGAYDVYIYF